MKYNTQSPQQQPDDPDPGVPVEFRNGYCISSPRYLVADFPIRPRTEFTQIDLTKWKKFLATIKAQIIAERRWTEKGTRENILNGWACEHEGSIIVLSRDAHVFDYPCDRHVMALPADRSPPVESVPVILIPCLLTYSWVMPWTIFQRLIWFVWKDLGKSDIFYRSRRAPRDMFLGMLNRCRIRNGIDTLMGKPETISTAEHLASLAGHTLLDLCDYEVFPGAVDADLFWRALLHAFIAGRYHAVWGLLHSPQVTSRLEESWLDLRTKRKGMLYRDDVAEAAGASWNEADELWHFDGLDGAPTLTAWELEDRVHMIEDKCNSSPDPD